MQSNKILFMTIQLFIIGYKNTLNFWNFILAVEFILRSCLDFNKYGSILSYDRLSRGLLRAERPNPSTRASRRQAHRIK